jgi:hypothetical protein
MKIRDLLSSLDKSDPQEPDEELFSEVKVDYYAHHKDPDTLKYYWLSANYCTDTWVGTRVYFLKEELVALSYQSGRKCDEIFSWVSKDAFLKVRDYLRSLLFEEDEEINPNIGDLDAEVFAGYALTYRGDLMPNSMHKVALLDGSYLVKVLPFTEYPLRDEIAKTVLVESEGVRSEVDLSRLSFPWNCKPEIKSSWSEKNQSFIAVYPPLPQLVASGKTKEEALNNLRFFLNPHPKSDPIRGKTQYCTILDDAGSFEEE